jgi:hypothetical protein
MPVTAKLSRKFYETFGDELTNELVEWLNQVDTSYRTEFRELFEVHFGRFDAKLDQRAAEMRDANGERRTDMAAFRTELLRWTFLFWIGTMGTVLALLKL